MLVLILTILDSLFAVLGEHTIQSDFTVTVAEKMTQPLTYRGAVTMRGECFRMEIFDKEAAFDGKTLYVYSDDTGELTLSEPSGQERITSNPFLFAKNLAETCHAEERTMQDGTVTVTLTPADKTSGVTRITVRLSPSVLNPATHEPMSLSVEMKEGNRTTALKMDKPHYLPTAKNSKQDFVLTKPDAYINDLR